MLSPLEKFQISRSSSHFNWAMCFACFSAEWFFRPACCLVYIHDWCIYGPDQLSLKVRANLAGNLSCSLSRFAL